MAPRRLLLLWVRPLQRRPAAYTPNEVFEIWAAEFYKAYEEGTVIVLTMHPKIIGHRSRIVMLEKLIEHMLGRKNVWFATYEAIARYVEEQMLK